MTECEILTGMRDLLGPNGEHWCKHNRMQPGPEGPRYCVIGAYEKVVYGDVDAYTENGWPAPTRDPRRDIYEESARRLPSLLAVVRRTRPGQRAFYSWNDGVPWLTVNAALAEAQTRACDG